MFIISRIVSITKFISKHLARFFSTKFSCLVPNNWIFFTKLGCFNSKSLSFYNKTRLLFPQNLTARFWNIFYFLQSLAARLDYLIYSKKYWLIGFEIFYFDIVDFFATKHGSLVSKHSNSSTKTWLLKFEIFTWLLNKTWLLDFNSKYSNFLIKLGCLNTNYFNFLTKLG